MQPVVAGGHALGRYGIAGLDELEEHVTLKLWTHGA
jgi:hypothetical protein